MAYNQLVNFVKELNDQRRARAINEAEVNNDGAFGSPWTDKNKKSEVGKGWKFDKVEDGYVDSKKVDIQGKKDIDLHWNANDSKMPKSKIHSIEDDSKRMSKENLKTDEKDKHTFQNTHPEPSVCNTITDKKDDEPLNADDKNKIVKKK